MLTRKDELILSSLRKNARETLTNISKKTAIPVSTIYDKLNQFEKQFIAKHTSLLKFEELGYQARANIFIKIENLQKESVKLFLCAHKSINSVYKIGNDFDFMVEGIFRNIQDVDLFLDHLHAKFTIKNLQVYYVIEDVQKEQFLDDKMYDLAV
jgi:DNA-binding Lrp family transcriptional regulator